MTTTAAEQMELEIFGPGSVIEPTYTRGASWAEKFEAFDAANPHVARALEALAGQWLAYHRKVSVKALFERLRWEYGIRTRGEAMQLNNSFTAYYARLLIHRRPEWADAIDTRSSAADERIPSG
jgi:hypothetical protein